MTTRKTITGVHSGEPVGIAPTGRPVSIDVIDVVLVGGGRHVEHRGVNTLPSMPARSRAG